MIHFTSLPIYPEIFLLLMASIVTLLGTGASEARKKTTYVVTQISLGVLALMHLSELQLAQTVYGMQRMVVIDPLGHLLALARTARHDDHAWVLASVPGFAGLAQGRVPVARRCSRCSASR